jgi:exonuclease SbcD
MRVLHTSDWHIGRSFHGYGTVDAVRTVLQRLVAQVAEHEVDVVLIAGDVFDSPAPAAECYTLLSDTLAGIRDAGARVVVTSGNHDSAARLGFQSALLRDGIDVITDPARAARPVTLTDADGPVHVYGIPFLEPALVRPIWPGARTQAEVLARAMDDVRDDLARRGGRSVVLAHCFAAGVDATPNLERDIQQGGLDVVPLAVFGGVDYAALGHIHGRATLTERVRYSGAPLHYSFGERSKPRGSWLVDLAADGTVSAQWLDLPVPRPVVTLEAPMQELLTSDRFAAYEDAWVQARYTDTLPERDAMRRMQARFPHCAIVAHAPADGGPATGLGGYSRTVRAARSDSEIAGAFLRHVRAGEGPTGPEAELLEEVIREGMLQEAGA